MQKSTRRKILPKAHTKNAYAINDNLFEETLINQNHKLQNLQSHHINGWNNHITHKELLKENVFS